MNCSDTSVAILIPDRNLAAEIRENLNLGSSNPIPLARLQELERIGRGARFFSFGVRFYEFDLEDYGDSLRYKRLNGFGRSGSDQRS